ncbi:MAG: cell division protein ZapA [Bacteroidetes bacterium]|nr:cell division protein ZapA [Bacteroidota bacterium]
MSQVNITVEIAGSIFPIKANAEDEQSIKEAVNLINNKLAELERNYAVKDKKDLLAMTLLQLVAQLYKQAGSAEKEVSQLKKLFTEVEDMLQQHFENLKGINEEEEL